MEPRIFHGDIHPDDFARTLVAEFNRGDLATQQFSTEDQVIVQIATRSRPEAGGKTALTVLMKPVTDGVSVQIGSQTWLGVAASLGETVLSVWRNPWNLIGRLDDLAQDVEYIQLSDRVWIVLEQAARLAGASFELSERLRRLTCPYCRTANTVGEASCIACGAPLGDAQPRTCPRCGFVTRTGEAACPNCGNRL